MNGLLRDYFPKGTDLWAPHRRPAGRVATELNDRPRKNLAWTTPAALFKHHVAALSTG